MGEVPRAWVTFNTLLLHLRPVRLPARTLRWTHTAGLGGSALVLALVLTATGALMMLVYQPVPGVAYDSRLGDGPSAACRRTRATSSWPLASA